MKNELPELPRKNNRAEAKIDDKVNDWFMKFHPRSYILEVKMVGGKVLEHQKRLLDKIAKTGEFSYKFRDGSTRTPGDYVGVKNGDGILCWCEGNKCLCEINNEYKINIKV